MPDESIKHAKVMTVTPQTDGTEKIETSSYYEQLSHRRVDVEKKVVVAKQGVLKELIDCSGLLFEGSPKVVITLEPSGKDFVKVTKLWTISKESFNRR